MRASVLAGLLFPVLLASPSCGQSDPIAKVAGQPIYEDDLLPLIQPQLRQLRNQEYELKSRALESLVNQRLLEAEAKKKGISREKLLEQEVDSKVHEPTADEVEAFYLAQKDRLKRPLEEIKAQLVEGLHRARIQEARRNYLAGLRKKADVAILLRPPRTQVPHDPSRVRGNPDAPVTMVEFSDFQCPFCQRVQPTLLDILAKYEGRVNLAFRDFPLREIHPNAQTAAEASRCAGEQGKLWEYHDLLFSDLSKLNQAGFTEHARKLGLEMARFDSCLSSGKYKAQVEEDLQAGAEAGISGAPAFFINGVLLSGAQPLSEFERLIDAELAAMEGNSSSR
jgi:protein-disulfide isomerase